MFKDDEIKLRALEPEDLEWLYLIENDAELWRWGNANVPYSRYILKEYIAGSRCDIYADGQMRLAVTMARTGMVVGCVDLMKFDARHLRAEVGIVVFPEFGNRGYGARVLEMLAVYCREHIYMHQLYAIVSSTNFPACRLFEKAGYIRTAELKDWLRDAGGEYIPAWMYCLSLQKTVCTPKNKKMHEK